VKPLLLTLLLAGSLTGAEPTFKVRVHDTVVELPRERYVAAVLAGEAGIVPADEALKAIAVAARTYAVRLRGRHAAEGYDFCSTSHCQRVDLDAVTPRLEAMAAATAGELLWYQGRCAFTPYSRDCGGRTEDAANVWPDLAAPYLKSHPDPYCVRAGTLPWQWNADPRQIAEALARAGLHVPHVLDAIGIAQRTPSGRALNLLLTGSGESVPLDAGSFRLAMARDRPGAAVLSDRYEVHASGGRIVFQGTGKGHGVGLCQEGAREMAAHSSYREILAFYYPGTSLGVTATGIPWQRLSGDSITLLTTDPQRDAVVLAMAERQLRAAVQRTNWPAPADLEVLAYPDLDTFRNATGEPGWVAAHTAARRIHLQPPATLRSRNALESTLRHEILHALVESQAAPGLPLWFREGLVEFLDGAAPVEGPVRIPADTELRQMADPARARRAYDDAARAVADLVRRNGESTVIGWVRTGMQQRKDN
jgi:stage II sporulation protein D